MTEQNPLDVAIKLQVAFGDSDATELTALFAPDGSVHVAGNPDIAAVGVHHGHQAVRAFFDELINSATPLSMAVKEIVASGTNVVALGHFHYRLNESGREYESDFALHLDIQHGLIQRYQMYEDSWAVSVAYAP